MVGRNSAALIAQIGQMSMPKITEGRSIDIAGAIESGLKGYDWGRNLRQQKELEANREALATALQAEDEAQIADAWAKADPMGYAQRLDQMKQERLEREQQLADDELKHQRAIELANLRNKGISSGGHENKGEFMSLLALKGTLDPNNPEDAAKIKLIDDRLAYLSQDPEAVRNISLGRETGKNLAGDLNKYRTLSAQLPAMGSTIESLKGLADEATYTRFGSAIDTTLKELAGMSLKGAKAKELYEAKVRDVLLEQLRPTFGAQFTEREGERLMGLLGKPNQTPEQKKAILTSYLEEYVKNLESLGAGLRWFGVDIPPMPNQINEAFKPTKAQQMQQGLSQIAPQGEQMSRYDFSKPQNIGRFKVREVK